METNGREGGTGNSSGRGDSPPVIPLWQEIAIQYLKIERLSGAASQALQAQDFATAARLSAELIEAVAELETLEKRARAQ